MPRSNHEPVPPFASIPDRGTGQYGCRFRPARSSRCRTGLRARSSSPENRPHGLHTRGDTTTGFTPEAQGDTWAAGAGKGKSPGRYADANGIKLYYEVRGAGRPLILLHGGLGAIEMFGPDIMGYSLGGGVALQTAIRHPEVVGRLVVVSTPFRRNGFYPDILAQQGQVGAASAEAMKPMPEDWPRLLEKIGGAMKLDFDFSREITGITATTLIVAGYADIFPPAHAVDLFGLLGGGQRDGGWDGSGRPKSRLAILPDLTHYTIFSDPALAATAIAFLTSSTTDLR